jgi:chloramphenicol-sensitive protein RarD
MKTKLRDESFFGGMAALGAYLLWGVFPIFWKQLQSVGSLDLLCHRIVWSLLFIGLFLQFQGRWGVVKNVWQDKKSRNATLLTAGLIGSNWLVYVWAVNSGRIVEASLGYYINPLFSVLLGVVFLKEKLEKHQFIAVLIAFIGVAYQTVQFGTLPWVSIFLPFTFGLYGLIHKRASIVAIPGFFIELSLIFIPAVIFLVIKGMDGTGAMGNQGWKIDVFLVLAGLVTAMPMFLFRYAAVRIRLIALGVAQYIAPTFQFLIGVFLYHEAFSSVHLVSFGCIWVALAIYTVGQIRSKWTTRAGHLKKFDVSPAQEVR